VSSGDIGKGHSGKLPVFGGVLRAIDKITYVMTITQTNGPKCLEGAILRICALIFERFWARMYL